MKLKKAIRIARKRGYNWIAVDQCMMICAFTEKPERFDVYWDTTDEFITIGGYLGKKNWKDTLRQVVPEVPYDPQEYPSEEDKISFLNAWECGLQELEEPTKDEGNGGSTPDQYGIPEGSKDLQDLIEYRGMAFSVGNVFKSCYRLGIKNTRMYELRKMKWFIDRMINEESKQQSEK